MTAKPSYEELEQRVHDLEKELADHKKTNGSVRLNQQYLESLLDHTNQPVFLKDADYRYLHINKACEHIIGLANDQIRGKDDYEILPEPVARILRSQDEEVVRARSLREFEHTLPLPEGSRSFLCAKFPLLSDENQVYAIGGICTDITALRDANEQLLEKENRFRSFIESFHGIAFRGSIKTFIPVYFYGAVEEITGYRPEDFQAGSPGWDQIVHPQDLPMLVEQGRSMVKIPGYTFRREYRIIRQDGETRWIFERGRTLCDDSGEPVWIEGSIFDVTDRKNMEQALRESEERYRTLVETASLGIQISDLDGRITFSNPAHHHILGLAPGKLVGRYVWDLVSEEIERDRLKAYYRYIVDRRPLPEPYFGINAKPDGTRIYVRVDWNYLRDSEDEVFGLCSIITDISAWVWAERTLKESERKFRSVVESCPEGIHMYRLEPDGRLIFLGANPAADKILGIDHAPLIGKTLEEAFPAVVDTEIPERYRRVCQEGIVWQNEQLTYKDGQINGVFAIHAFQSEPGTVAIFFQDVTARHRIEEELRKIQKLESVGILAGGIAHDFNNLLTAILGNISMAKLFSQSDPSRVLERLTDAENASLRARDLTQQLLTFSKGGAPVRSAASITEIVKDSASFMLSGSNVTFSLDVPADLWHVNIDQGQISQVIQNIIKNADQAMPEGGTISIRAENLVSTDADSLVLKPGNYVHLTVSDEGVGIHAKHLAKIFDPYFTTKQEGSGLGLAACHSIINNHEGLITAESEPGRGATFHLYLPSTEDEPEAIPMPRKEGHHSGERILIMDDDADVLNVAVNMLNIMGYKTETACNGSEAISLYRKALQDEQPFDGVILDLTIPGGMGGAETVRQLQTIDPEVKAVVSSGYANDPIMAEYAKFGFLGVVTKPYDMEHLGQILHNLFN